MAARNPPKAAVCRASQGPYLKPGPDYPSEGRPFAGPRAATRTVVVVSIADCPAASVWGVWGGPSGRVLLNVCQPLAGGPRCHGVLRRDSRRGFRTILVRIAIAARDDGVLPWVDGPIDAVSLSVGPVRRRGGGVDI